jgi:hypothetical protein
VTQVDVVSACYADCTQFQIPMCSCAIVQAEGTALHVEPIVQSHDGEGCRLSQPLCSLPLHFPASHGADEITRDWLHSRKQRCGHCPTQPADNDMLFTRRYGSKTYAGIHSGVYVSESSGVTNASELNPAATVSLDRIGIPVGAVKDTGRCWE